MKHIIFITLLACLFINSFVCAQTRYVDSLRSRISSSKNPDEKAALINLFAGQAINADTLLPYLLSAAAWESGIKTR